jgi:hypothetical protein
MYRIVYNEVTDLYRVEKRGLLGWGFVTDPETRDYLSFGDLESAKCWVRDHTEGGAEARRWRVVTDCTV